MVVAGRPLGQSARMDIARPPTDERQRLASLIDAETKAFALLDAIEQDGFIAPGRTEREVEQDILALATERFGIEKHWHKRIVRCGPNTLATAGDNPPILTIGEDDMVFLDLGPVFEEWEADVGRSYAIGPDPRKHALCRELPIQFETLSRHFRETPDITGAELYALACRSAEAAGWRFGGKIAGHLVGEFPHARVPGDKQHGRIAPENPTRMRGSDIFGRTRHWILEVHLVAPDGSFGGFYERLLLDNDASMPCS
jgi:Xaa-Pro aminopeptidase